jgi:hypothetical protein
LLPPRPASTFSELEREIERVRLSDESFREIDIRVLDREVRLRGRRDPAFLLARLIARLPGVERVVIVDESPAPRPSK